MLQTWMNVEDIRLSERSQLQKKKKKILYYSTYVSYLNIYI